VLDFDIAISHNRPPPIDSAHPASLGIKKHVRYTLSGPRYHTLEEMEDSNGVALMIEAAYDGTTTFVRQSRTPAVMRSQRPGRLKPGTPPPHLLVEPGALTLATILTDRREGRVTVRVLRNEIYEGIPSVVVALQYKDGSQATIHYATKAGFWPVSIEFRDAVGSLVSCLRSVVIEPFNVEGNTVYYPTKGIIEGYKDGTVVLASEWGLKKDTIDFNVPVPDDRFRIEPENHQHLLDLDTDVSLKDASKGLDVTQTINQMPAAEPVLPITPTAHNFASPSSSLSGLWLGAGSLAFLLMGIILWLRQRKLTTRSK
jgi:hypothetical protein